jgi:hypothetical protein
MTWETPSTSMPRAAMSVATSTRSEPSRKPSRARSRAFWTCCRGWRRRCGLLEVLHDAVGAVLGAGEHQRAGRWSGRAAGSSSRRACRRGRRRTPAASIARRWTTTGSRRRSPGRRGSTRPASRMSGGMVAEKKQRLALRGQRDDLRFTSWMKPMSSMRSASSSTKISTSVEVDEALAHEVEQAARRGDQHVDAALQLPILRELADAAEDDGVPEIRWRRRRRSSRRSGRRARGWA